MKRILLLLAASLLLAACNPGRVNYAQALFEHVPEDPDLLVLVRPDDVTRLMDMGLNDVDFEKMLGVPFKVDAKEIERYRTMIIAMLDQLGIPIEKTQAIGFLWYMEQPVVMLSGGFTKEGVEGKLTEIGFAKDHNGFFDYVYDGQKISIPADGLMMMARVEMLEDLSLIPAESRLWNRPDFKKYRESSPLDNSLFIWSHPPDNFLSDFEHRDALGDVSLAANFRNNLSVRATVRIKDPQKTVALYNIIFGGVTVGRGVFSSDPELSVLLNSIVVSQDNQEVVTNMVLNVDQLNALRTRIKDEFQNQDFGSFDKIETFFKNFR